MPAVRQEIIEALNAVTTPINGDPIGWAKNAAEQWCDALCAIVASLDDADKTADVAALKAEVQQAVAELSARISLPWGMELVLPALANAAIDQIAAYSGAVEAFKHERLLPLLSAIEAFGHRGRAMLDAN